MLDYSFSYQDLEYFLLILIRVASFVFSAPFFSMSNMPRNVRIGLSFFMAVLLYHALPDQRAAYETLIGYFNGQSDGSGYQTEYLHHRNLL